MKRRRLPESLPWPWRALTALLTLVAVPAAAGEWGDEEETPVLEGTVEGARTRPTSSGDERALDDAAMATATPEESLEALAGAGLLRDGGPLAPVRLRHRGLEGARLGSELMGLRLNDPITGGLDVAALPLWGLARASTAAGGTASVRFYVPENDEFRFRLGAGTLETLRVDLAATTNGDDGTRVSAGASAATTKGDFVYAPATTGGRVPGAEPISRQNNDQRRAAGLVSTSAWLPIGLASGLAWGSAHEGGVPGFASAPTAGLRGRNLVGGARASLAVERGWLSAEGDAAVRGSSRATWDDVEPRPDVLASLSTSAGGLLEAHGLVPGMTLQGSTRVERASLLDPDVVRDVIDVAAGVQQKLLPSASGISWLSLAASVGGTAFSDSGILPRAKGVIELGPTSWATGLSLSHGGRAPTLDELYAPRGLVLGNADLSFERSSDVEVYLRLSSAVVEGRVAAFAGRMEDSILFVNKNAFEVQPVNTGPLVRAGLEGRVSVRPHALFGLEVTAAGLASRLDATRAALPVVPPLSSRIAARLGELRGGNVTIVMRHRSPVSNNLYGTLLTPGYVLVDVVSRLPLSDVLSVTAALTNALDVLDARDANLLPLPGRQLFVALEVRS